ncbi:MAG: alpha-galactosidase, partial [Eubacterium sp.]|nr:alpha-galactosidase [Eubacterium sp.]
MSINFNDEKKIFTIQTKKTTYQMMVDDYGYLLHLYYGRKTHGIMDYLLTYNDRGFSGNPYEAERDRTYSLDTLPQEYPAAGGADYRNLAINAVNSDGSYGLDMRYVDYEIRDGKYSLQGLPAVYADEKEAQTLTIILEDEVKQIRVELYYGVLPEIDIITRAAKVTNLGAETIHINKLLSSCLDLVHGSFEVITFYGKHCMERETQRKTVGHGTITVGSKRGMSSHQYNPCVILTHPKTTEGSGACFGFELVYSGGFIAEIEKDQFNQTRVLMGMSHEQLSYPLEHSQSLIAPEVMMTFSGDGLAGLSHNFHDCIRDHIIRGKYQKTPRPVLLNSWEALYMDFNGKDIYQLAKSCADLDIDLLVMDDGWFGHRDTDTTSLGDWVVNEEKLGEPLGHLIERINALGMKFGIWFEPECVSEDSDLYRAHPDWALAVPGRNPIRSRYQLVLDFSRKEVVDAVFDSVCKVLDQGNIEYVKWDMNRSLSDVYSAATKNQGRVFYDYVLGLYDFLERIHVRYPHILIEGCSGGGGRFDAG